MLIAVLLLTQAISPHPTPDPTPYLLIKQELTPRGPFPVWAVAPIFPTELLPKVQVTTVIVDVLVDRQGLVRRATVVEGDTKAHKAAIKAAQQWVFEPLVAGLPERPVTLSFTFRTLPAWAPPEELVTVFGRKYGVEVRALVASVASEP